MIEFQIEKVKNLQKESKNSERKAWEQGISIQKHDSMLFQELCNVVLELLAIEKERQESCIRLKTPKERLSSFEDGLASDD